MDLPQKHHNGKATKRKSMGSMVHDKKQQPVRKVSFSANDPRSQLEARDTTLAQLNGSSDSNTKRTNAAAVPPVPSILRQKSGDLLHPNSATMTRNSNRNSMAYKPRSNSDSFIRPQEALNSHSPVIGPMSSQSSVSGSRRPVPLKRQTLPYGEFPTSASTSNRKSRVYENDGIALTDMNAFQNNAGALTPTDSRHSAIYTEGESDSGGTSPALRHPRDRPDWSQQDEGSDVRREQLSQRRYSQHRQSLQWTQNVMQYPPSREARIAAENEAARKRHSGYGRGIGGSGSSTPAVPAIPSIATLPKAHVRQRSSQDLQKRQEYQERLREQRRAESQLPQHQHQQAGRYRTKTPVSAHHQQSTSATPSIHDKSPQPRRTLSAKQSVESMPPTSQSLHDLQQRKLRDLQRRQSLAAEQYARKNGPGSTPALSYQGTPIDARSEAGKSALTGKSGVSLLGEPLDGMTQGSIRLLREKEKLVRWKAAREKMSFEKRTAGVVQVADMGPEEEGVEKRKAKRRGLLCCFGG